MYLARHNKMEKDPPLTIIVGEELYVELGNRSTPSTSQFTDVIKICNKSWLISGAAMNVY